jgi:hypothetical protein
MMARQYSQYSKMAGRLSLLLAQLLAQAFCNCTMVWCTPFLMHSPSLADPPEY